MTDLITKLSEDLHAMIQSSPRSPTKEEIAALIVKRMPAPSSEAVHADLLNRMIHANPSGPFPSPVLVQWNADSGEFESWAPYCFACDAHHPVEASTCRVALRAQPNSNPVTTPL